MELTLSRHSVAKIRFDRATRLDGTTLLVDSEELRRLVLAGGSLAAVECEIVHPGESCRAAPIFDIIEPRAKARNSGPDFPGILGPPITAGMGTTHVLKGAAVTVLRERPPGDSRGATGYVLEMSGSAAAASPYGALCHLIVMPHTRAGLPGHARQQAYRMAGLKIAVHLARVGLAPSKSEARRLVQAGGVYVNNLGSEGQDRVREAYGTSKYDRLAAIKTRVDPENVLPADPKRAACLFQGLAIWTIRATRTIKTRPQGWGVGKSRPSQKASSPIQRTGQNPNREARFLADRFSQGPTAKAAPK